MNKKYICIYIFKKFINPLFAYYFSFIQNNVIWFVVNILVMSSLSCCNTNKDISCHMLCFSFWKRKQVNPLWSWADANLWLFGIIALCCFMCILIKAIDYVFCWFFLWNISIVWYFFPCYYFKMFNYIDCC